MLLSVQYILERFVGNKFCIGNNKNFKVAHFCEFSFFFFFHLFQLSTLANVMTKNIHCEFEDSFMVFNFCECFDYETFSKML